MTDSLDLQTGEPTFYHRTLTVGDPDNCIGICTLWTPQDKIARQLQPGEYGRIGNLYSRDGINHIIRNVFAEPVVRHIIICGVDLTGSGEAFLRLARNGIDADHRIRGDTGLIDRDLPRWAIDEFRETVTLVDLRGTIDAEQIRAAIAQLPALPPFGPPRFFPSTPAQSPTFPSEKTGFVERGKRVADTWLRLLGATLRFGDEVTVSDGSRAKRIYDARGIVTAEDPASMQLPEWLPVTAEYLSAIAFPYLLDGAPPDGAADSDGRRLFDREGIDQIARISSLLRAEPDSSNAVATVWDLSTDFGAQFAPVILSLQASVTGSSLHLSATLREIDLYRSWPETAFALRQLQGRIAAVAGGLNLGPLSVLAHQAFIADDVWTTASDVVEQNRRQVVRRPRKDERDPRGSFVIRLEKDEIRVDHYSPQGVKLQEMSGASAAELFLRLQPYFSQIDHALHIGGELQKAEIALRNSDFVFLQDHPLERRTGE